MGAKPLTVQTTQPLTDVATAKSMSSYLNSQTDTNVGSMIYAVTDLIDHVMSWTTDGYTATSYLSTLYTTTYPDYLVSACIEACEFYFQIKGINPFITSEAVPEHSMTLNIGMLKATPLPATVLMKISKPHEHFVNNAPRVHKQSDFMFDNNVFDIPSTDDGAFGIK